MSVGWTTKTGRAKAFYLNVYNIYLNYPLLKDFLLCYNPQKEKKRKKVKWLKSWTRHPDVWDPNDEHVFAKLYKLFQNFK